MCLLLLHYPNVLIIVALFIDIGQHYTRLKDSFSKD